jgi:site-specific recombinase XerD
MERVKAAGAVGAGSNLRSMAEIIPIAPSVQPQPPRLLDRVRIALRTRHYSLRTEEAYVAWIKRFIFFHGKRHPQEMGETEINAFLSDLAVNGHVSASTQNQALAALLFLYRRVLDREFPDLDDLVRAKRTRRLPVVLTRAEVRSVLARLNGTPRLVCTLLYGTGMRLMECLRQGRRVPVAKR